MNPLINITLDDRIDDWETVFFYLLGTETKQRKKANFTWFSARDAWCLTLTGELNQCLHSLPWRWLPGTAAADQSRAQPAAPQWKRMLLQNKKKQHIFSFKNSGWLSKKQRKKEWKNWAPLSDLRCEITPQHPMMPLVGIPLALVAHHNVSKTLVCSDVALSALQGRRAAVFTRLRDGRVYFSLEANLKCLVLMLAGDLLRPLVSPCRLLNIEVPYYTIGASPRSLLFTPATREDASCSSISLWTLGTPKKKKKTVHLKGTFLSSCQRSSPELSELIASSLDGIRQLIKLELYSRSQASGKSCRKDGTKSAHLRWSVNWPHPLVFLFPHWPHQSPPLFFPPTLFLKEFGTAALWHEWDI